MATIPNKIWAEVRMYSPEQNVELMEALMLFHEACEKDPRATLIWQSIKDLTALIFVYCAPVEKPDAYKCFYDIPFVAHILEPKLCTVGDAIGTLGSMVTQEDNYT